ncbi:MAG: hypothetical protein K2X91_12300, partial [Thermoleophilia bacterium]|nr:hypothetical protein [Thermoleophilia bacterium]
NMLQRPSIETYLEGLKKYPSTTLGHLISFMHSFNLTFGPAATPEQGDTYDQLYPLLVALRNQAQSQGAAFGPPGQNLPPPNPAIARSHFSSIGMDQLQAGPPPAPAPAP